MAATASPPPFLLMPRPRRRISVLLFFLPTSLLAASIFLFFLACNNLSLPCLSGDSLYLRPIPTSFSLLAVKEDAQSPLLKSESLESSNLSDVSANGYPHSDSTLHSRVNFSQSSHLSDVSAANGYPPSSSSLLSIVEYPQSSDLSDVSANGYPQSNSTRSSHLSGVSATEYPHPNSSLNSKAPKRSRSRRVKALLQFTHAGAQSKPFAVRATEFFNGNSSCKPRFFMTWLSSSDEGFGQRELFSVESVFRFHPNACLLIVSNSMDSEKGARLLRPFSEWGFRIGAVSPNFSFLFKNTPAGQWFDRLRRGEVDPGEVPIGQNLSNLLRLAILYKYGGVYIDTDVIVMKSFLGLKNVIGAQAIDVQSGNWSRLNNAVMVFDRKHPLLYKFIEEFALTFDGSKWGYNGPYLVSRVVARVSRWPGFEFKVLPPPAFYPVDWSKIGGLFHGPVDRNHARWMSGKLRWLHGESFALHLWNRQSRRMKIEEGSIIWRVMTECCLFCNSSESSM